jgi:TonB-dependent receptor
MHQSFRTHGLALFLSIQMLLGTCVAAAADADKPGGEGTSASNGPNALAEIVVTAQRTTEEQAREAQMVAPNILNIQTYSEIRKLPDVSAGEALRRIPGVSLETDEGEGRYINIRGFDADLNSTTFGGLRLPPTNNASPFNGYRAVTMDSIPIGLVGALTVTKSGLPSMDPEWLGGTVEITPKTAPSDAPWFAEGAVGTGYEPLRQKPVYDVSITTGGRLGPFSAVLTYAINENWRGFDDVEPAVYLYSQSSPNFPYYSLGDIEQRDYELNRKRHAYGIDLGFQPDDDSSYYIRAFDAGYTERYWRQMLQIQPDGNPTLLPNGQIQDGLTDANLASSGNSSLQKILRDEKETSKDQVLMVGGKNNFGGMVLDYRIGWTKGDWSKPYDYYSIFQYQNANGTITYSNTGLGHTPAYSITGAAYTDPTQYQLASFTTSSAYNFDKENSYETNLTVPVNFGAFERQAIKTGVRIRRRHKGENVQPYTYNTPPLLLSQAGYGPNETYYAGQYQNGIDIGPGYLQSILPSPTQQAGDVLSAAAQYLDARENVYAAYIQYDVGVGPLGILGGVRVEQTKDTVNVNQLRKDASGNTEVTPISASNSYTKAFPSLQTRFEIQPTLIARATYAATLARPGFNQFAASTSIDLGASQITEGNPKLKPAYANNFDVAIEKYLPNAGIASVGVFYKKIKDYIVGNNQGSAPDPATGQSLRLISFSNASGSYAQGLELNWEQHFTELPGVFSGLGAGANLTLVDSRFDIRPGEHARLPSTSKETWNANIFYEKYGLGLRLAAYSVSADLFAIGGDKSTDVYNGQRTSMDFGGTYQFSKSLSMYITIKNLLNTPHRFYIGAPDRPIQREFYRQDYLFGIRYDFEGGK